METYKTYVFFSDHDQGHSYLIDTIFYQEQWWLVGSWLESTTTGERVPEWLVLLDTLRHQEVEGKPYRFLLNDAIPKSVLGGKAQEGYVIAAYQVLDDTPGSTDNRPH